MRQQLEKVTISDAKITVSTWEEISEPPNQERIAALANEFWRQWTTRQGLASRGTLNCQIKEHGDKESESQHSIERLINAGEVDPPPLRSPVRSRSAHAGAPRTD